MDPYTVLGMDETLSGVWTALTGAPWVSLDRLTDPVHASTAILSADVGGTEQTLTYSLENINHMIAGVAGGGSHLFGLTGDSAYTNIDHSIAGALGAFYGFRETGGPANLQIYFGAFDPFAVGSPQYPTIGVTNLVTANPDFMLVGGNLLAAVVGVPILCFVGDLFSAQPSLTVFDSGQVSMGSIFAGTYYTFPTATSGVVGQLLQLDPADALGNTLSFSGARYGAVVVVVADYVVLSADNHVVCNRATAMTVTLPAATGSGREIIVSNVNLGDVLFVLNGADTINGEVTEYVYAGETLVLRDYAAGKWVVV